MLGLTEIIYLVLTLFFSTVIIYGVKLYVLNNNRDYMIGAIISANLLIYTIYKMFELKYSIIIVGLVGKILPMAVLALINIFIFKDTLSLIKKIGLVLVMIGAVLLL